MLQLSKKMLRGTEHEQEDVSLSVKAVAAQLCPAAVQQLQALLISTGRAPVFPDSQGMQYLSHATQPEHKCMLTTCVPSSMLEIYLAKSQTSQQVCCLKSSFALNDGHKAVCKS